MWRLLRAELSGPLRVLVTGSSLVLLGLAGLRLITAPGVPVLQWAISTMVMLPLLVNVVSSAGQSTQQRLCRQVTLPLTRRCIGFVWLTVPALIQALGGLVALALVFGQRWLGKGSGSWTLPILLTCALLLASQWVILQRELVLRGGGHWAWAVMAGLGSVIAIAVPLVGGLLAVDAISELTAERTATAQVVSFLSCQFVVVAVAVLVFLLNLQLFATRDVRSN